MKRAPSLTEEERAALRVLAAASQPGVLGAIIRFELKKKRKEGKKR